MGILTNPGAIMTRTLIIPRVILSQYPVAFLNILIIIHVYIKWIINITEDTYNLPVKCKNHRTQS